MCKKIKAFTLIELLVVISIIALLLSVLVPSLQKAKKQARRILCASNFHQIAVINQTYAVDYNAWIPRFATSDGGWGVDPGIGEKITSVVPYLIDKEIFDSLNQSYGTENKFWVCPSLLSRGGKRGFLEEADFDNDKLPQHGDSPYPYVIGIARLNGLVNMTNTEPSTVKQSSAKPVDGGTKVLAADLNIRWDFDWGNQFTVIAHSGSRGNGPELLPEGGYRLYTDGSTNWITSQKMGENDGPITEREEEEEDRTPGKYNHWKGSGRDYFW